MECRVHLRHEQILPIFEFDLVRENANHLKDEKWEGSSSELKRNDNWVPELRVADVIAEVSSLTRGL